MHESKQVQYILINDHDELNQTMLHDPKWSTLHLKRLTWAYKKEWIPFESLSLLMFPPVNLLIKDNIQIRILQHKKF